MGKPIFRWIAGITAIALISGCGSRASESTASPEPHKAGDPVRVLSAARAISFANDAVANDPNKNIELSPEARMLITRGPDYEPIPVADNNSQPLFDRLESSMPERRAAAWQIVERMLAPQKLTFKGKDGKPLKDKDGREETYDVPLWHTWYEGSQSVQPTGQAANQEVTQMIQHYIGLIKACRDDDECADSPAKRVELAKQTVAEFGSKSLAQSFAKPNMERALNQLARGDEKIGVAATMSPHLGNGFTLFSPSFVEHMLSQAQGIEQCYDPGKAKKAIDLPPSASQFSSCITEFPRSAVMVKASWGRINPAAKTAPAHNTSGPALRSVLGSIGTAWPNPTPAAGTAENMYTIQASDETLYGLNAIHFSTKDTREWIWVTLWWDPNPNLDFGADRPTAIANYNQGVWANYKMCVTTAFNEGDPAPWSSYEASAPTLAAAIKASHQAMAGQAGTPPHDKVTTWCSNPNVERHVNNDETNCIGCHQYSLTLSENRAVIGNAPNARIPAGFDETIWLDSETGGAISGPALAAYRAAYPQLGRSRMRQNFPADFAWSTSMEFQRQIRTARRGKFEW